MKKLSVSRIALVICAFFEVSAEAKLNGKIVLGFSQIGAESSWRTANTKSIKDAAKKAGIILDFADGLQKQENQIRAIKSFIFKKVDVIAFSPVVSHGWHDVLVQAKRAKIPVILIDRLIDEEDRDLYLSSISSDFFEEGRLAGQCLWERVKASVGKEPLQIVELRGTEGSAPATQRKKGFEEFISKNKKMKIVRSENGDFKENLGKEWMEKIIRESRAKNLKIDAIYAHNDEMALGAIPAIEAAGLRPGKDIFIVSIDATRNAFLAMQDGKLNCSVECSPLLGPLLMKAVNDVVAGHTIPRKIVNKDAVFTTETAAKAFPSREY